MNDGLSVRFAEPMARHTPLRTGGPCDAFVVVHRVEALGTVLTDCRDAGWRWRLIGAGTRTVFRDGPTEGVVMRLGRAFGRIERIGETSWRVGGAVPVPALVATLAAAGHGGLEGLAGVPGSVGSSLVWDGAWGGYVDEVSAVSRDRLKPMALEEVAGRLGRVVAGATITLRADSPERVRRGVDRALAKARPGAWYRLDGRGDLREVLRTASLPLVRLRRVAIPDAAPELLVNLGEGQAADLALLHKSAAERVKRVRGIELESVLRWVGADLAP